MKPTAMAMRTCATDLRPAESRRAGRVARVAGWPGPVAAVLAMLIASPLAGSEAGLSDAEANGRQIYREGTSGRGGEVRAVVGSEAISLPASAVPCASCHGTDGIGRPEGGVIPPDIRWSQLTKVYGHVHEDGRRHPAFDEESLEAVIRTGIDPAGNQLDRAMPVYAMSDEDMQDLVAYLKRLESHVDPGVSADRIQVATLVPLDGPHGAAGKAIAQVLHGYFGDLNAGGGVFNRRIDLLVVPHGAGPEATIENMRLAMAREGVFAVVGPYSVGLDEPLLELLQKERVPLVGPFTLDPGDEILNTNAFYIFSGFEEQARVLADEALAESADPAGPLVLVGPAGDQTERLAGAVRDQLKDRASTEPPLIGYAPATMDAAALAGRIADSAAGALFFFGSQRELDALLAALAERDAAPGVYLLGGLLSPPFDAPPSFNNRIYMAYPTVPADVTAAGRTEYQALAQRHALPPDHLQAQLAALAAAKVFVAALREAGRNLNREVLEEGLEALYQFQTGVTPPLTYGPTRRIGARGAYLMVVDLFARRQRPVGSWVELR